MSRAFDILHLLFEGPKQIDPATRESNFQRWFAGSKVVDAQGNPKPVYHGTRRPDRIGNHFQARRATSGPMSFFTEDPEIAGGYATNKADTSLGDEIPYANWFKYRVGNGKRALPLSQAWFYLTPEEKQRYGDGLARVTSTDEDGESMPDGQYRLADPGSSRTHVPDYNWQYELKRHRGNAFMAAVEGWLHSGTLFNDEESFMDVLKHAGVDMSRVTYDSPHAAYPAIYKCYLSIKNPLDTSAIPPEVIARLRDYSRGQRARVKVGVDQWHKAAKSGSEWMRDLENDFAQGTTFAWTCIPDWVTKVLRGMGYDGIKDTGGKYQKVDPHNVWIPFDEGQIKSVWSNKGTYSGKKLDDSLAAGYLDSLFEANPSSIFLHRYLSNNDPDPYHNEHLIKTWADEEGLEHPNDGDWWDTYYDDLSPEHQQEFQTWLNDNIDHHESKDPMAMQANRAMSTARKNAHVPPNTWLIHFTDADPQDIARDGFLYGSETDGLHLTTYKHDRMSGDGTFAFAFVWNDRNARRTSTRRHKYGTAAVLFQSSAGVEAVHYGDEENQVVFDRESTRNRVPIYCNDSEGVFEVRDERNGRVLFRSENIQSVAQWIINHFRQYARVMAYAVG